MRADPVRVDRILAVVLVCLGLGVVALAVRLPPSTAADPVGPRGERKALPTPETPVEQTVLDAIERAL